MVVVSAKFNLLEFDRIVPGDDLSFKTELQLQKVHY